MNTFLKTTESQIVPVSLANRPLAILDRDLAKIYNTETMYMNKQVMRNKDWFDETLCFKIDKDEMKNETFQNGIFEKFTHRPVCYTQAGCISVAFLLRSAKAIKLRRTVVEIFARFQNGDLVSPANPEYYHLLLDGLDYRLMQSINSCKKLNYRKYQHLVFMHRSGRFTEQEIARYLSIPRKTLARFIDIANDYDKLSQQIKSEKSQAAIAMVATLPIDPAA